MARYFDPNDPYNEPDHPTYPPNSSEEPPADPGTTTPPVTPPWPTYGGDLAGYINAIIAQYKLSPTSASLDKVIEGLKAAGLSVSRATHAGGTLPSDDKLIINGQTWDLIRDVGGAGAAWTIGGPQGEGGSEGTPITVNPEYLAPWTKEFKAPEDATLPGAFNYKNFEAPDPNSIFRDPSYEWRLGQGLDVLQNKSAAQGMLNTGGTLAAITDYGQGSASQEYKNIWDRALQGYLTNWNTAKTGYETSVDRAKSIFDRAWGNYVEDKNSWFLNQDKPWSKLVDAARVGSQAAQA